MLKSANIHNQRTEMISFCTSVVAINRGMPCQFLFIFIFMTKAPSVLALYVPRYCDNHCKTGGGDVGRRVEPHKGD